MTTSDLIKAFHDSGYSEVTGLNLLQDNGIISDLCVWASDVAEVDIPKAIAFIYANTRKSLPREAGKTSNPNQ